MNYFIKVSIRFLSQVQLGLVLLPIQEKIGL
jgi:hypothetical protein